MSSLLQEAKKPAVRLVALIEPGDTVMGMDLAAGGTLDPAELSCFSGQTYNLFLTSVDPERNSWTLMQS